jgi:uncharacterized membrane protein
MENGFNVTRGVAGMPSAFVATYGIGKPIIGIMEICDLFSDSSERVAGWLRSVEEQIERFRFLHSYGALMLIPIIWIPGIALYGSPLIAWIFQWNRLASILCMVVGWLMASVFVLLISLGLTSII